MSNKRRWKCPECGWVHETLIPSSAKDKRYEAVKVRCGLCKVEMVPLEKEDGNE